MREWDRGRFGEVVLDFEDLKVVASALEVMLVVEVCVCTRRMYDAVVSG